MQATDGNFYGTTIRGGSIGYGTVFRITATGVLTTLHNFDQTDGYYPLGTLIEATDGSFYGTTEFGGTDQVCFEACGTLFRIVGGELTTLYSWGSSYGVYPLSGITQDTNGTLYGENSAGGSGGKGTIYALNVGLGPFVETQPTMGQVGSAVVILGTNLTGTTSVTFNGTSATFSVVSDTEITTTVPTGATTGPVQVTTLSGTLTSNVVFRVR